jgi:hypothetical protein
MTTPINILPYETFSYPKSKRITRNFLSRVPSKQLIPNLSRIAAKDVACAL